MAPLGHLSIALNGAFDSHHGDTKARTRQKSKRMGEGTSPRNAAGRDMSTPYLTHGKYLHLL